MEEAKVVLQVQDYNVILSPDTCFLNLVVCQVLINIVRILCYNMTFALMNN